MCIFESIYHNKGMEDNIKLNSEAAVRRYMHNFENRRKEGCSLVSKYTTIILSLFKYINIIKVEKKTYEWQTIRIIIFLPIPI